MLYPTHTFLGLILGVSFLTSCGLTNTKLDTANTSSAEPATAALVPIPEPILASCELDKGYAETHWQPLNLWDRIRHGYELPPQQHRRINQHRAWFKKHPTYLDRVAKRAEPYLFDIVEQLESRNMPREIALLPIVESAFDPFAYSPGRASGMWQIIPGTGTMLGLKQSWWYDGRRDGLASTRAALTYLEQLQKRFDGDWLLALAAYNSGAGTVNRAIRKNKKRGVATDFWNLDLPKETRDYVPKLLAIAEIFEAPKQFNVELPQINNEPYFEAIDVGGQIDLAQAANMSELSMDEFYALNAGFNRWATDPEGPHRLLIPLAKAEQFKAKLANLPAEARVRWKRHTIKPGETLSHIAKTYNISVSSLESINELSSSRIRAGKTLLVPTSQQSLAHYSLSAEQRLRKKQNSGNKSDKQRLSHVVVAGDSFWRIAKRYSLSANKIAKWNNMAPKDPLRIGQKLVLWIDNTKLSSKPSHAASSSKDKVIRKLSYKVRSGDSLYKIASKFKVGISDILKWNQIKKNKYLQPGQSLVLFVNVKG